MKTTLLILFLFLPGLVNAKEFVSAEKATDVIELYTSEGCSSCPRADRWLSTLKDDDGLFRDFIPVAFHVDYWNYLGWEDRFSKKEYSQRQRGLVHQGLVSQVYTPGFVVNSREWRSWFKGSRKWDSSKARPGVLKANIHGDRLLIEFQQKKASVVHVAILGSGLSTKVESGENRGRQLDHDFVVLEMVTVAGDGSWDLPMPVIPKMGQKQTGLAVWVSPPNL